MVYRQTNHASFERCVDRGRERGDRGSLQETGGFEIYLRLVGYATEPKRQFALVGVLMKCLRLTACFRWAQAPPCESSKAALFVWLRGAGDGEASKYLTNRRRRRGSGPGAVGYGKQ